MAMVRSVNRVMLVGRVGSIFPRKKMKGDRPGPLNISVSTQEIYRENKTRSDWHRVTLWGGPSEFAEKYLEVGALVAIEGRLRTTQIKNSDGSLSSYVNIEGNEITLLVKSPRGERPDPESEAEDNEEPRDDEPEDPVGNDDIPF